MVSVFGGFIGIAALAVGAPILSNLALLFAPRDYLMLAIWGILLVGSLSGESLAKGVFAGALFAFVTSFDEVIVILFIGGPEQRTLPRQMF
mgnify:CR=1 FL=1